MLLGHGAAVVLIPSIAEREEETSVDQHSSGHAESSESS